MIAEEDYENLMETMHLLRSPANAVRLLQSIGQANSGAVSELQLKLDR